MDFTSDFASAQKAISQALVNTTRSASQASAEDAAFHRSVDPAIGLALDRQNARLLSLAEKLLRRCASSRDVDEVALADAEAIDGNWRALVDVADNLLERADTCLDEYNGLIKQASPRQGSQSPAPTPRTSRIQHSLHAQNLPKPQLLFDTKPTNQETDPFEPLLTAKPHAIVPLQQSLAVNPNEDGVPQYQHPYAPEIRNYRYPSFVYTKADPVRYLPFETTTATFVEDLEGVRLMLAELKKSSVVAIDLEHHDTHSYVGIVSLMQISTRDRDWIVDTLKPWRRKLEILNEVLADPSILKVLHGAHMDIMWLQRDLGLYIVGLFDTHHASRVLGYAGGSLAFLLKKFVDFDAQKQYQTADWRLRPLPSEMFDYARSDTHFLLYIYDNMRNELVDRSDFSNPDEDRVRAVLERSKETALQQYEHAVYDDKRGMGRGGWFALLSRTPALLSKEQFAVFRKLHQWRDHVARQEDEGPFQIMPNHALFSITRTLPHDIPTLLSVSHPISQPVRLRASELLQVIQDAMVGAIDGPGMADVLSQIARDTGLATRPLRSTGRDRVEEKARNSSVPVAQVCSAYRLGTSQFWGSTLTDFPHEPARYLSTLSWYQATPRLPQLAMDRASTLTPVVAFEHRAGVIGDLNGESGLRLPSLGRQQLPGRNKRKVAELSDGEPTSSNITETGDSPRPMTPVDDTVLRKMQRRAEKKAAKQARQSSEHSSVHSSDGSRAEAAQPFDYASAPSVLHASNGGAHRQSTNRQAPFNPYTRAADAPSGLRKAQSSRAGKSSTFKH